VTCTIVPRLYTSSLRHSVIACVTGFMTSDSASGDRRDANPLARPSNASSSNVTLSRNSNSAFFDVALSFVVRSFTP
jgi:hypothetical protein